MQNATMLYRSSDAPNEAISGLKIDYCIVDADEVEGKLAQGWFAHPDDVRDGPVAEPTLIDRNAPEIIQALPGLSDDDLLNMLDAETAGKTRKGVIAAIEAEVKSRENKE